MDATEFALRILETPDPDVKLASPNGTLEIADDNPILVPTRPKRNEELKIVAGRRARVPSLSGWGDPSQRVRWIHALANHELQAVELFAWAYLKFHDAPKAFRAGLLRILLEEQIHTNLYRDRLREMGSWFGEYAVSGFFWNRCEDIESASSFVCAMSLTFENANLDHTLDLADEATLWNDSVHRELFLRVHSDERRHVQFGLRWLKRLNGGAKDESLYELYLRDLPDSLDPSRCRGRHFRPDIRRDLGFDAEFIRGIILGSPGSKRDSGVLKGSEEKAQDAQRISSKRRA